jgi:cell division inhibitor SulA
MLNPSSVVPQPFMTDLHAVNRTAISSGHRLLQRWPTEQQQQLAAICAQITHWQQTQMSSNGWLLLLAPPLALTKTMLAQLDIPCHRILLIQHKQIAHFDNLMRDALTCSTCSAVLSFLPTDHPQLADYHYLSVKYGTDLYNLTTPVGVTTH